MILGRIAPDSRSPDLTHHVFYDEATVMVCGVMNPIVRCANN